MKPFLTGVGSEGCLWSSWLFPIIDMKVILCRTGKLQVPTGEGRMCVNARKDAPGLSDRVFPQNPTWKTPQWLKKLALIVAAKSQTSWGVVSPWLIAWAETLRMSLSDNLTCCSQTALTPSSTKEWWCSLKHFTSMQTRRKSTWKIIYEQPFSVFECMPAHWTEATPFLMDFLLLFVILVW